MDVAEVTVLSGGFADAFGREFSHVYKQRKNMTSVRAPNGYKKLYTT